MFLYSPLVCTNSKTQPTTFQSMSEDHSGISRVRWQADLKTIAVPCSGADRGPYLAGATSLQKFVRIGCSARQVGLLVEKSPSPCIPTILGLALGLRRPSLSSGAAAKRARHGAVHPGWRRCDQRIAGCRRSRAYAYFPLPLARNPHLIGQASRLAAGALSRLGARSFDFCQLTISATKTRNTSTS